jgi:hypothetical protein
MSKVSKLTLVLGFVFFLCASTAVAQEKRIHGPGYEKGKIEAYQDLKNDLYILKGWGLAMANIYPWPLPHEIYASILRDKYQITLKSVGGCVVDDETADYVDGYNEVSHAAIESKWGKGILDAVMQQANTEYETKYGARQREYDKQFRDAVKSLPKKEPD